MCTKTLKQKQYLYRNTVPKGYQCLSFYELLTPAPVYLTLKLGKKTTLILNQHKRTHSQFLSFYLNKN